MRRILLLGFWVLACSVEEEVLPVKSMEWQYYTTSNGLGSNVTYSLFEDSQDRLWIGTNNGVSLFDGISFTNYTTADGLVNRYVNAITESSEGDMLFGTDNGLGILSNGSWFYVPAFSGVPIYALRRDKANVIWVGTLGYGIVRYNYEGGTYQQDLDNSCSLCNNVNVLYEDDSEQMWVGTDGGLKRAIQGTSQLFTKANGLAGNRITAITGDGWGNLWFGASDSTGVTRYRSGYFEVVPLNTNDIVPVSMSGIQEDAFGQLWIGYGRPWIDNKYYSGLSRFDGVIMRVQQDGPPVSGITAVLRSREGSIFIGTNSDGIARFKPIKF
jgi:ligand-binding sensor domain-containing protein